MAKQTLEQLLEKMWSGDTGALARLMTLVERESDVVGQILETIGPKQGSAFSIGIRTSRSWKVKLG